MAYRLGIDIGTTNTVASIAVDGAPVQLVGLGSRSQQTRSVVFLAGDGQFLAGDTAAERGANDPSRMIIDPLRQLGTDVPMVVGGQEITAEQATAALISFVVAQATAQQHQPPSATVVSHPAHWDEYRVECFDRAITAANLGTVSHSTDAEAAVATYAARESLNNGARVVVYDLGAGSCEATVLEKTPDGTRILTSEGTDHPSGADFDEAVFRLVLNNLGDRGRELDKDHPDSRRRLAEVRRACTQAKEALSTATEAQVPVSLPGYNSTISLGRQEFVSLVRPALRESVGMTGRVLHNAGVQPSDLAAIILVGGCCRMPIVAELLQREFDGVSIALGTHPEYDIAIGSLLAAHAGAVTAGGAAMLPTIDASSTGEDLAPVDQGAPTADQPQPAPEPTAAAEVITQPAEDATTVITQPAEDAATVITAPMAPANTVDHPPVPAAEAPAPIPEETMPDHLIFDYFTSDDSDVAETIPGQAAYAATPSSPLPPWAQASVASSSYPPAQRPPGSPMPRPGSAPSPGQYPPGQYPGGPGSPGGRAPGYSPGTPPTQPYGARGPGGPGGYPPGPGDEGPGGSRGRLILIIAGALVLVGIAVGVGFLIAGRGEPGSTTASPSIFFPTPTAAASVSPTPNASLSPTLSGSPTATATSSGGPTASPIQKLPSSAAIPESEVIVPMRFDGGPDRPLYLVDTEGKIKQAELPSPEGGNSNPVMQATRNTIIYANAGKLRVMAADGSGDRKLFNRDPAGCDNVAHASWSLTDPNVILITCQLSKNKFGLLVVGLDGRLIRRLDAEKNKIGDAGISPDGQTVLYWASDDPGVNGGALYTLPMIGTGNPKQLTKSADGVDADPAWSPDGNQIAFRRKVPNPGGGTNEDVFVMNADGTAARAVTTTPAADFKPVWSPDNKNLLIISNRKSAFGGPGSTFDLWLTRVSDGEVLTNLDLKARQITRPFWTQR